MRDEIESEIEATFARGKDADPGRGRPVDAEMGVQDVDPTARAARLFLEQQRAIGPAFVPIARSSSLAEPGAYVTADVAGVPVAAVRQPNGEVHAFVNVCAHRGAQVLRERTGKLSGSMTCPYHALVYGLDGTLKSCPEPRSFPEELAPVRAGLERLASGERLGWIWVRAAGGAASLDEFLGPDMLDELVRYPVKDCAAVDSLDVECAFDWKIGVEAFLEPFHVPAIHARSAHPVIEYRAMATRRLGKHSRMALPFRLKSAFEPSGFLGEGAHAADVPIFPGLNAVQRRAHLVYLVYPYTILTLLPNHLMVLRFEPLGVGRCALRYELLALPPTNEAAAAWLDSLKPGYRRLIDEDLENLPWIERGLASGRAGPMQLSSYERRIDWFRSALAEDLAPSGESGNPPLPSG